MTCMGWDAKEISVDQITSKIRNGSSVYIGSCASTPEAVLEAMVEDPHCKDIEIIQLLPGGKLPHQQENIDRFRTSSFFCMSKNIFKGAEELNSIYPVPNKEGLADYRPISSSSLPRMLEQKVVRVDVAVIKVTRPHKGFCCLGFGVEHTLSFIRAAKVVIAEVSSCMPYTEGRSKILCSEIDYWIFNDERLKTTEELWPEWIKDTAENGHSQETFNAMGKNLIELIPDGATLKFGWSPLTVCIFPFLSERKNLGLHTDVLTESMFRLQVQGVFNNSEKTVDTGSTVVTHAHGSQELYQFCDRNPAVQFQPASYVNDPLVLGKIDRLMVVEGALKVDLTGQVASDSIANKFYGGVWSTDESMQGAQFSKGGKKIVCLPSRSPNGRSNISCVLPPGSGVTITRSNVEYIVTEYGIANLYGKSIRERCITLIGIAHPEFRNELLVEAKALKYISGAQPGKSFQSKYPSEFECLHTTKNGEIVFVRPVKASDEDLLRKFFHTLSDHSVYLRYFRKMDSMPQLILQKYADIDYSSDMALIVLWPPPEKGHTTGSSEMIAIGQWFSSPQPHLQGRPEIAFQVRDDWQGEGLGKYLFMRLVDVSKSFGGIISLKADVLADNQGMRHILEHSGVPYKKSSDFGVVSYTFELPEKYEEKTGAII